LELKQRLLRVAAELLGVENSNALTLEQGRVHQNGLPTPLRWKTLVSQAYMKRIGLSAQAHYATPDLNFDRTLNHGKPFAYHVYGSAAVEVTVDCLRGSYLIDRVDIVHDDGQPLDEMVDRGQVEGGVVQGLGWLTLEEVVYDAQGHLLTDNLSNYKIPDLHFAPSIDVHFLESVDNPPGLLHSKAVGEPPFMYGIAGYFALIRAILAFNPNWQADFRAPLTPERVLLALYSQQAKAG
jgi:xanthine dehydrogenase large subunit